MKDMKKMMAMMDEKRPSKMSANDIQAKKDILKELLDMADGAMKGKLGEGMKGMKVSVMAKDEEGMKEGLEKAEELVEARQDMKMEPENELAEDDMMEEAKEDMLDVDAEMKEESEEGAEEAGKEMMPEEDEEPSFFGKKKKKGY